MTPRIPPELHKPRTLRRPFPVAPLVEATKDRTVPYTVEGVPNTQQIRADENRRLGVTRGQRRRMEAFGLDAFTADRLAIRSGLHPAMVWGVQWWAEVEADSAGQEQLFDMA